LPPIGVVQKRKLCPLCSREVAEGYLSLHKKLYCPMRPGRQEEIKVEAMGFETKAPPPGVKAGAPAIGTSPPPTIEDALLINNIKPINLMEDYQNMVKVMKKKQEEEEEYECGGCHAKFNAAKQPKHCPECGCEF
jgi:hypothetical protein